MKPGALAGYTTGVTGACITLIIFLAKHYQWVDFGPTEAAALVTVGGFVAGHIHSHFTKAPQ